MRILLVIPSQYCREGDAHDRIPSKVGQYANLSVLQVAACTPPGHDVEIVDDHFEDPDYGGGYDLVGITSMTPQVPRAYEIAARFRAQGIPVVMGGYHATLAPDDALQHLDAVVIGEAEKVWPLLLEDVRNGRLQQRYKAEGFVEASEIPIPRYDLLEKRGYYYKLWPVQVTRGCPLVCSFCSVTQFFDRSYRMFPLERALEAIRRIPVNTVFFTDDDLFIGKRSHLIELFKAMEPLGLYWFAQSDIRSADNDDLLDAAYRAGCRMLYIGFESLNEESLKAANKGRSNKPEDYARIIAKIRSHGIQVMASMILGLEEDRPGQVLQSVDFLIRNKVSDIALYMVTPLPGTPMAEAMHQRGQIKDFNYSHYIGTYELIEHPHFRKGEMLAEYWQAWRKFYSVSSILRRFLPLGRPRDFHLAFMILNLLVSRKWVRRGVHPFVANGYPGWMAWLMRARRRLWQIFKPRHRQVPAGEESLAAMSPAVN